MSIRTTAMSSDDDDLYSEQLDDTNFRLLKIDVPSSVNRTDSQPVTCHLVTFPLEARSDYGQYTCLSYAWHEPLATRSPINRDIKINGQNVSLQPNLAHAIQQHIAAMQDAGLAGYEQYFWVDALCINQADDAERSRQVAIMHEIYRGAWKVIVWLGPDPDQESDYVRAFFRAILQFYLPGEGLKGNAREFLLDKPYLFHTVGKLPAYESDIWRVVLSFLDRVWFNRAWVQQEVALSSQVEFWCGDVEFTFVELAEVSSFMTSSGLAWTLIPRRQGIIVPDKGYEGAAVGQGAGRVRTLRDFLLPGNKWEGDDLRRYGDRFTGPGKVDGEGRGQLSLLRIFACQLHLCFTNDASDDRDKVFALLVLMKQVARKYGFRELPLGIDYTKSTVDVYREATACVIEQSGWLGILALVQQRRLLEECHARGMPSWVVDFSATKPTHPAILLNPQDDSYLYRLRRAQELLNDVTRPKIQGSTLEVSIRRIGTIMNPIGNSRQDMVDDGWLNDTAKLLLSCPPVIASTGKTRIDWWIQILKGQHGANRCDENTRAAFGLFLRWLIKRRCDRDTRDGFIKHAEEFVERQTTLFELAAQDETGVVPSAHNWRDMYADAGLNARLRADDAGTFKWGIEHQGRRLFRLTNLGFQHCPAAMLLGIGPETIQVGDDVCVVAGSMMPFVLRRRKDRAFPSGGSEELQQAYFIGEAYVNGMIEAIDMPNSENWDRWQLV